MTTTVHEHHCDAHTRFATRPECPPTSPGHRCNHGSATTSTTLAEPVPLRCDRHPPQPPGPHARRSEEEGARPHPRDTTAGAATTSGDDTARTAPDRSDTAGGWGSPF